VGALVGDRVSGRPAVAVLADQLTDTRAEVLVWIAAGGLAILGLVLLVSTVLWWRGTRPEPEALAPLEVMSQRRWDRASDAERRRLLDEFRPADASARRPVPVALDLAELTRDRPDSFDDLREDAPERSSASLAALVLSVDPTGASDRPSESDESDGASRGEASVGDAASADAADEIVAEGDAVAEDAAEDVPAEQAPPRGAPGEDVPNGSDDDAAVDDAAGDDAAVEDAAGDDAAGDDAAGGDAADDESNRPADAVRAD
jgi:hypothetical protein